MAEHGRLRRRETSFVAEDGARLHRRSWLPDAPHRQLLLVHGYAEHCGRYEEIARWFGHRGFAVHAYDHRGHGRSEGRRAHVENFDEFVDDLAAMVRDCQAQHAELPFHLVGHSMGGLVTAAYLARGEEGIESAALSASALAIGEGISSLRITAARLLRRLAPTFAIGSGLDPEGLSRDAAVVKAYLEDPLIVGNVTASMAYELLEAVPRTAAAAPDVRVPVLVMHGEADPICPPEGSIAFAERVAQSRLKLYPNLRHEIFNEPEREHVFQDVLEWLEGERP
ncbi:MAG: alpha/beta hydrolase [Myxococcota bacterium]|nr:alpha/beta hydrolase [Myxococcota bacterium]